MVGTAPARPGLGFCPGSAAPARPGGCFSLLRFVFFFFFPHLFSASQPFLSGTSRSPKARGDGQGPPNLPHHPPMAPGFPCATRVPHPAHPEGNLGSKAKPELASSLPRPLPGQTPSPFQESGQMQPRQLQGRDRAGLQGRDPLRCPGFGAQKDFGGPGRRLRRGPRMERGDGPGKGGLEMCGKHS